MVLERLNAAMKRNTRTGKGERVDWGTRGGEMTYGTLKVGGGHS